MKFQMISRTSAPEPTAPITLRVSLAPGGPSSAPIIIATARHRKGTKTTA